MATAATTAAAAAAANIDVTTHATTNPALNNRVDRLIQVWDLRTAALDTATAEVETQKGVIGTLALELEAAKADQVFQQTENRGRINHGAAIAPLLAAAAGDKAMTSRVLKATSRMLDTFMLEIEISRSWSPEENSPGAASKQLVLDNLAKMQRLAGLEAGAVAYVAGLPPQTRRFQLQELIESAGRAGAVAVPEKRLAIGEFDPLFVIPDAVITKAERQLKPAPAEAPGQGQKRPWQPPSKGGGGRGYGQQMGSMPASAPPQIEG